MFWGESLVMPAVTEQLGGAAITFGGWKSCAVMFGG